MNNIYLSVIAASRNDDHGNRLDERTNLFIKSLAENSKKYKIPSELILVEWNQIPNTKTLSDRLNLTSNEYLNSKIITVSKDIHLKILNSNRINFFQMIAKNVGIKKALGKFILATNIDVIINQKIYKFISEKKLKKKTIYRCNRHCIDYDYSGNLDDSYLDQFTNFIDKKYYSLDVQKQKKHYVYSSLNKYIQLLFENFKKLFHDLIIIIKFKKKITSLVKKFSIKNFISICKKIIIYLKNFKIILINAFGKKLFTNACGDFTLLDKNSWIDLKGYSELPIFSWHLDSLLLWEAKFKKYQFYNFNDQYYIYHINHNSGGRISIQKEMFENLNRNKIPYLTNEKFLNLISKLEKDSNYLNKNYFWGLHNEFLH